MVEATRADGWRSRLVIAAIALGALVIAVLAALFRAEGVPKWHTLWAEDGRIFGGCAWQHPYLSCLFTPYQGYIHFVPRTVAAIAVLGDPTRYPLLMTLAEGLVAGIAAALVARALAESGVHPVLALIGGAALALVYQAGREVGGEIANVHLTLFAAATVILACQLLGRSLDLVDLAFLLVTGVTTAFSPALPVIALGGLLFRTRGSGRAFVVALIAAVAQGLVELVSPRTAAGVAPSLPTLPAAFFHNVILDGFFGGDHPLWGLALFGLLLACMAVLVLGAIRRRGSDADHIRAPESRNRLGQSLDRLDSLPLRAFLAAAGLSLVGVVIYVMSVEINRGLTPRYAYVPTSLLVAALAIAVPTAIGVLASRQRARDLAQLVVAVALAAAFAATFRLAARTSGGPNVVAELHAASSCTPGTIVQIPISPKNWQMPVPCDRIVKG